MIDWFLFVDRRVYLVLIGYRWFLIVVYGHESDNSVDIRYIIVVVGINVVDRGVYLSNRLGFDVVFVESLMFFLAWLVVIVFLEYG